MRRFLGPLYIFLFILLSAFRDVFYPIAFRDIGFFLLIALSFSLATVTFLPILLFRRKNELALLYYHWPIVIALNLSTALAWFCYFFALKWLEPAIANTIWSGLGPLLILLFAQMGFGEKEKLRWLDYGAQLLIALSLFYLTWVVMTDRTGLSTISWQDKIKGLLAITTSAISIIISVIFSKKLNQLKVSAISIVGIRFLLLAVIAWIFVWIGRQDNPFPYGHFSQLVLMAMLLVVIPIYFFQAGLNLSTTFTTETITAFGPVLVILAQGLDQNLSFSIYSAVGVAFYSLSCLIAIGVRLYLLATSNKFAG